MTDLVITDGTVVDGLGGEPRRADIAIDGGRISSIGAGLGRGDRTIDATGRLVIPGAIDIHTHDDFTLPLRPQAEARVRQGVTTTVTGNCGFSPFPLDDGVAARRHGAFFEPELERRWPSLEQFADDLEPSLAVNVAPLLGLGAVRLAVVGEGDRPAEANELAEMRRLVEAALAEGAFGASTGLVYAPGCYAAAEEISAMLEPVASAGGFYATHMRNEAADLEDSVAESIAVGRAADCPIHISHHKAIGRANWGKVRRTLAQIEAANRDGADVTLDAYPYAAGSSTLLSLVPVEHQGGGVDAVVARLADPAERPRLVAAIAEQRVFALADVVIALAPSHPQLEGMHVAAAAAAAGTAPAELVADLIAANGVDAVMVAFGISDDDVRTVLGHSLAMVGSDGWVMATDASPHPHPRNFSTTARFLTEYVRDRPSISLAQAVRKLSALPAKRLGLADRGTIEAGAVADLVVLDLERLTDEATYERPWAYPTGIDHVLVGGTSVLERDELTAARPGRVLRSCQERR